MAVQIFLLVDLDTYLNAVAHAHTATAHSRDEQQQAKAKQAKAKQAEARVRECCRPREQA